jgi:hypothetical protein
VIQLSGLLGLYLYCLPYYFDIFITNFVSFSVFFPTACNELGLSSYFETFFFYPLPLFQSPLKAALQVRRKYVTETAEYLTFMKVGMHHSFSQGVRVA